jgi:hypothetical protein
MRKRRLLLGLGLLTAAGVLVAYGLMPPKPGVTPGNFRRLQKGMTLAQVEASFGRPPEPHHFTGRISDIPTLDMRTWADGQYVAVIFFDKGRVELGILRYLAYPDTDERAFYWPGQDEDIFHRLRRLLPW